MKRPLLIALLAGLAGCTDETPAPPPQVPTPPAEAKAAPPAAAAPAPTAVAPHLPGKRTLLLSQAQFTWSTDAAGKRSAQPGAAKILMLTDEGGTWRTDVLTDEDSRVFHKAQCVNEGPEFSGVLTIGGSGAKMKLWRPDGGAWRGQELWSTSFGGKWDRLRDFELFDANGDGVSEIAIATHDQGVVALARRTGGAWAVEELTRKADTFVHEIEVGEVDGDGAVELYVTPSDPNRANVSQSGGIWAFTWDKKKQTYAPSTVESLRGSHAKEILVTDLDGDGRSELYAAVEAELVGGTVSQPVEVRRYEKKKGKWSSSVLAKLERGLQARVLLPADLTGSGTRELVVTTMKDGIWRLLPPAKKGGAWSTAQIDAQSTGFEHAAGVADLDADGKPELYVAADDQDEVRRYVWDGKGFARTTIASLDKSDITWNIVACGGER